MKDAREGARQVVVSNPRLSLIEEACLKPLQHPGKLALLDPGRGGSAVRNHCGSSEEPLRISSEEPLRKKQ